MRNVLIAATWIAIAPAGAMAQQIASGQRPNFTPPTVAPTTTVPLASGDYKLTIVLPATASATTSFTRQLATTLVHTGSSIVLKVPPATSLQGTLSGNSITLSGSGAHNATMALALTPSATGASGTVVVTVGPSQRATGTATLVRVSGAPASNLHSSLGDLINCRDWVRCIGDLFGIDLSGRE